MRLRPLAIFALVLLIVVGLVLLLREGPQQESSDALVELVEPPSTQEHSIISTTRETASQPTEAVAGVASPSSTPQHRVDGVVVGQLGLPVEGATVAIVDWPRVEVELANTISDGQGRFSFEGLERGTKLIHVEADGYTPGRGAASFRGGATEAAVHIRLWDGTTLTGRITDSENQPVPNAEVMASNDYSWVDGGLRSPECRTNSEGEFRLPGVPVGRIALRVRAPGFAMAERISDSLQESRIDVQLEREGGTRIEVELKGLPLELAPQATLSLYPTHNGSGFSIPRSIEHQSFDSEGKLVLDGLLSNAEWNLQMPEVEGWVFEPRSHRVPAGGATHRVTYEAVKDGSIVMRGVLRTANGTPLSGEQLACHTLRSQSMNGGRPGKATTDAEGRFELIAPLTPDEPYSIHLVASKYVLYQEKSGNQWGVSDPRYRVYFEGQATPDQQLELIAVESPSVSGWLLYPDDQPVPFQWVELQVNERGEQWSSVSYAVTAADGAFRFTAFQVPKDDLRIFTKERGNVGSDAIFLNAGQHLTDVKVRVEKTGSVSGIVRDELGVPMAGLIVSLRSVDFETGKQNDRGRFTVLTDRNGRYRVPHASTGGKRIEVKKADEQSGTWAEVFEVFAGQEATVDLVWIPQPPKEPQQRLGR